MFKKHNLLKSFYYAFTGIGTALREEPNFRIHFTFAAFAIIFAFLLNFNYIEWSLVLFAIFFVLSLELINTVMETIVDIVSPELQPKAKKAKDVAAAGVLLAAIFSVLLGFSLYFTKLINLLNFH